MCERSVGTGKLVRGIENQTCKDKVGIPQYPNLQQSTSWTKKENSKECLSNSEKVKNYAKRFPPARWSFLGPGDEDKWYGTHKYKLEGKWNITADVMVKKVDILYSEVLAR